jgi:zinc and cadmium transporter
MNSIWLYALGSVIAVSLISIIGIFTLGIKEKLLKKLLIYFVSFSAGALFGDVFIHLLPEITGEVGFNITVSSYILVGIVVSFVLEKIICWRHCHIPITEHHVHRFALMNLFGDMVHNFIDGLILGAAYLVSIPVGIATTVAIILHEIPQEIGDFGVLIHGGFTRFKALYYNFLTALTAILGTVIALFLSQSIHNMNTFLVPFAAGSFIYIAGSDLIPELHKEEGNLTNSSLQIISFVLGIGVMMLLLLLG